MQSETTHPPLNDLLIQTKRALMKGERVTQSGKIISHAIETFLDIWSRRKTPPKSRNKTAKSENRKCKKSQHGREHDRKEHET